MDKRVVVTGVNGFVGEHLAREFKNQDFLVVGIGYEDVPNQKLEGLVDEYISCDLVNADQVDAKINFKNTAAIIHLAGLASVGQSFEQPRRYITDNGLMAYNIMQRALADNMPGRVVVISTGALYNPNQPLPLSEMSETNPNSPYAVGKLMTEDVTEYFRGRGLDTVLLRPFNHIGPGQGLGFILPDLYDQLSENKSDSILVGNLETRRDYTDVRDIVQAYRKIALAPSLKHSLYNICSGVSLSGLEILEILKKAINKEKVTSEVDQTKTRPNDIMEIVGDSSRLQSELDWTPGTDINQTIVDFVNSKTL